MMLDFMYLHFIVEFNETLGQCSDVYPMPHSMSIKKGWYGKEVFIIGTVLAVNME